MVGGGFWAVGMLPARRTRRRERVIRFDVHCPRNIHWNKKNSGHVDLLTPSLSTKVGEREPIPL